MIKFEDPIQFNLQKESSNLKVSYSNLMEISQGGPEIGNLSINGKLVDGYRFGGPCMINGEFVYAPVYVKKFFGTGFKLSQIHAQTLEVITLGKVKDLIYLDKVEDGKVYFFEDINKTISRNWEIN
ncbi:MAG: hypothetical protein N4A74_17400 [Carboxylicivirga sp.]|nr:hypothetical protein [Carboxylicivirga sp.]